MQLVPPPGPTRLLAGATFVNTFGNGLFYTGSVLFFTRSVELSPGQVGFGLTFAGAPETAQGQYQGLYSTGFAAVSILGPLVVTLTAIRYGTPGWVALGLLFAGAGAATVPVDAWAERTRRVLAPAG